MRSIFLQQNTGRWENRMDDLDKMYFLRLAIGRNRETHAHAGHVCILHKYTSSLHAQCTPASSTACLVAESDRAEPIKGGNGQDN